MIQISRYGVEVPKKRAELRLLREEFRKNQHVKLKDFVEPELLKQLRRELKNCNFVAESYEGIGKSLELRTRDGDKLNGLMHILLNDDRLISAIKYITGRRSVRRFLGRVYKMKNGHQHGWHDDDCVGRKLALSLNLGGHFEGGEVMFRDKKSKRTLRKVSNRNLGEAILFLISSELEHRTVPIKGRRPKTAFVGWFY